MQSLANENEGDSKLDKGSDPPSPSPTKTYDASNIVVLEGLDGVRKRPSMYIGSQGIRGFHHLASEVIDNSIDEVGAGCTKITVTLNSDNSLRNIVLIIILQIAFYMIKKHLKTLSQ